MPVALPPHRRPASHAPAAILAHLLHIYTTLVFVDEHALLLHIAWLKENQIRSAVSDRPGQRHDPISERYLPTREFSMSNSTEPVPDRPFTPRSIDTLFPKTWA
jgi:hypothetical protein